jgi:DNA primase
MNYLIREVVEKAAKRYNMKRTGQKWEGVTCPDCGTSRSGNRKFHFWDDGGWKCWSCEKSGDIISWLRGAVDNGYSMQCAEAHEYVNADCLSHSCPYVFKCRITRGQRQKRREVNCPTDYQKKNGINIVESVFYPHPKWVERLGGLVEKARSKICHEKAVLDYLAARGVTPEIVEKNRFGWLPHDETFPVEELGMVFDPEGKAEVQAGTITYKKKKLWVPGGIIMPLYSNGELFAVDVRRTIEARKKFLPNLKYVFIKGGGSNYRSLWDGAPGIKPKAVALIESRLDASMVAAACPDVAFIVGKDKPLSQAYADAFSRASLILICTDNDEPNKSGLRAGEEKAKKWEAEFSNAHFWPVPEGKDPGEFFQRGGDIRSWIMAGIEKYSGNVFVPSPRLSHFENFEVFGQTIYIVDTKEQLQQVANLGKIGFERESVASPDDFWRQFGEHDQKTIERLLILQKKGCEDFFKNERS